MPLFEYACTNCSHTFETLIRNGNSPACPTCQSTNLERQLSTFAAHGSTTESMKSEPTFGPCGACGDPRGPGACSFG